MFFSNLMLMKTNVKFGNVKKNLFCNKYHMFSDISQSVVIPVDVDVQQEVQVQEEVVEEVIIDYPHEEKKEEVINIEFREKQSLRDNVPFISYETIHDIVKEEIKDFTVKRAKMANVVDAVIAKIRLKKQMINGWKT